MTTSPAASLRTGPCSSLQGLDGLQAGWSPGYHPGNPRTVMTQYRRHILSSKKRWGSARGLIHYRGFIASYLWAKRAVLVIQEHVSDHGEMRNPAE